MHYHGFLPLVSISLFAQASTHRYNWVPVECPVSSETSVAAKLDLRYALHHNTAGGWQVVIKNFGTAPVTFRYWIRGAEEADHAMTNPFMHLSAGAEVYLFPEQAPLGLQVVDLSIERGYTSRVAR